MRLWQIAVASAGVLLQVNLSVLLWQSAQGVVWVKLPILDLLRWLGVPEILKSCGRRRCMTTGTLVIQERVWRAFTAWLASKLSQSTLEQLFLCPSLAVWALQQYGLHLYSCGGKLYELRHLLVLVQRKYPRLRAEISPAWELISRWEELHPVRHREPLPEVLFKAMFVLAYLWKWKRVAATLLLGVEGIARIGELLAARRADLFLPSDAFDSSNLVAFLKVKKPKTLRRGLGRVQHLKIKDPASVLFLEKIFGALDPSLNLCPLSASAFRRRWNKLLDALQIPVKLRPTPGGHPRWWCCDCISARLSRFLTLCGG